MNYDNTLILAHYYTVPEVQNMADYVGDSLDLAQAAVREKPKRIIFAGVQFMAETAKILNPDVEVILPDSGSTCSLVTQTKIEDIATAINSDIEQSLVTYINSSAELKMYSDWIVTSRNVEEIITHIIEERNEPVYFAPDRNMGAYLAWKNPQWGEKFRYHTSVCVVHDQFKEQELINAWQSWSNGRKWLIAHPESPLPVLKRADFVGSTKKMLDWVKNFEGSVGRIYVATEDGLLYNMRAMRPDLDIQLAPMYTGCQCNSCPFMKLNNARSVQSAIRGESGHKIDYLKHDTIEKARKPIERMLAFGS